MALIIGSRALAYWLGPEVVKPGSDLDLIGEVTDVDRFPNESRLELHCYDDLNNRAVADAFASGINWPGTDIPVCTLEGLMVLKRSHLHRDRKWDRHMWLFQQMFKTLGECPWWWGRQPYECLLRERIQLTYEAYGNEHPSLDQGNEEFFSDAVTRDFDHDWLHEQMAYYDEPIYTKLKLDHSKARCEKHLWDQLICIDKRRCVLEEAYVTALERFLIPAKRKGERVMPSRIAVIKALKKICTTMCSGWFRDWAIDEYGMLVDSIDTTKMDEFLSTMEVPNGV